MTNINPSQITYHEGFDDPAADMVIEVNDGFKFQVHSYLLKANSHYFRDLPEHDKVLCGDSPNVIMINGTADAFKLLIYLLDDEPIKYTPSWSEIHATLKLGVAYRFFGATRLVVAYLEDYRCRPGNPWPVFVFASKHEVPLLAQKAIADFAESHLKTYSGDQLRPVDMSEISGKYAIALARSMREHAKNQSWYPNPKTGKMNIPGSQVDWSNAAKSFSFE